MTVSKDELLKRRPITPDARERIDQIKRSMALQTALHELRERRHVTQAAVAEAIGTSRPNVGRIESEADVRVSTLARYIEALGGHVEIQAVFDDERVDLI